MFRQTGFDLELPEFSAAVKAFAALLDFANLRSPYA
jgi:hypothetical protein